MKALSSVRPALQASLALAALAAAACPSPFGSTERRLAVIELGDDPPEVVVPATATAGTPFEVRVTSYGGGCISAAPTRVSVSGSTATVEPYQVITRGRACTADFRTDVNVATVRFNAPGTARVIVRGLNDAADQVVTVERTVQVQ